MHTNARQRNNLQARSNKTNGCEKDSAESRSRTLPIIYLIVFVPIVFFLCYFLWWQTRTGKLEALEMLFRWVEEHTGDNTLSGLHVQDVNKSGISVRGLVATRDFSLGSEVWRVHSSLVFFERHESFGASGLENAVQGTLGYGIPMHLTLFLAIERCKTKTGLHTFWQQLIQVWPTPEELATFSPYYASDKILAPFSDLLVVQRLKDDLGLLRRAWETNSFKWRTLASRQGIDKITFDDFLWAYVMILHRAFVVKKVPMIVPVSDLANTNEYLSGNVEHRVENHGTEAYVVYRATEDIAKGTEITVSYGNRTNDVLFQGWGFVLPKNLNKIPIQNKPSKDECAKLHAQAFSSSHPQISMLLNLKALADEYCLDVV